MNMQRFTNPLREPIDHDAELERELEKADVEISIKRNEHHEHHHTTQTTTPLVLAPKP